MKKKIFDRKRVDSILGFILILLMTILVIDVLWQVASRYLFRSPNPLTNPERTGFRCMYLTNSRKYASSWQSIDLYLFW